jgi:hypothetical protein
MLLCFTVTSSYAAVGLQTTPIRALADDLEVRGTDKWWLRQMVAKAEKIDNPAEIKASTADGYQAGVAFCEISCGGGAGFLALSAGFLVLSAFTAPFLVGPPLLWGIAGVNSKPPKGLMKEIQQSKGQEYVAGFVKGYSDKNKKQKRYAVVKGGVITFILVYALLRLTQDVRITT